MDMSESSSGTPTLTDLIENVWVVAALAAQSDDVAHGRDSTETASPERDELLRRLGLPLADDAEAAKSRAGALRSTLQQALAATESDAVTGWGCLPDEALISQGNASRMTGRAVAGRIVPSLDGLTARLSVDGARILDVGTGIGAIASVFAETFPEARIDGIDILPRVLDLARERVVGTAEGERITFVEQNVAELDARAAYDLVWLPAPFIDDRILSRVVHKLAAAVRPGGWVVVGTNPEPPSPTGRSIARWRSARSGGGTAFTRDVEVLLRVAGATGIQRFPTVPGGPVLVAATVSEG
jgi:SAM-dependent methyltransferase